LFIYSLTSNELLADGEDFESQMTGALIQAMGWHLDDSYLNGSGSNQPLGVLNDPALVVVAKETNQAASTLTYTNIVKMFARMHPASAMNSVWVCNQATIPQLMEMSVTIGTAGSHVPVMHETDVGFTLLTRPVVFTEKVPTLGSEGDISLIDFSQYVVGIRREMTLDSSMHVGFSTDETAFRAIVRSDGQGKWAAAYTPKNGDSQSWCVTLAARA
jgi:HK97 family phage major capsid protein